MGAVSKPVGEGTGPGLPLSYDIVVKGHGEELKVETNGPCGATFQVVLPI